MFKNQKLTLLAAGVLLIAAASCSKSKSGPSVSGPLGGTWKFNGISVNMYVRNTTTVTGYPDMSSDITTATVYSTTNNGGTVVFMPDSLVGTGLTYAASWTSKGYGIQSGVQMDTLRLPLSFTLPPFNNNAAYKLVGTDSITFGGDAFTGGYSGSQFKSVSGGRYVINGNTLTITSKVNTTSTSSDNTGSTTSSTTGTFILNFQR